MLVPEKVSEFLQAIKSDSHELGVVKAGDGQTQGRAAMVGMVKAGVGQTQGGAAVVVDKVVVAVVLILVEVATLEHSTAGHMQVQSGTSTGLTLGQGPAFRIGQSRVISFLRVSTVMNFLSVGVQLPLKRHPSIRA